MMKDGLALVGPESPWDLAGSFFSCVRLLHLFMPPNPQMLLVGAGEILLAESFLRSGASSKRLSLASMIHAPR